MDSGVIDRLTLLKPGQTINSLEHGIYYVTGGCIEIGHSVSGNVTKIVGISINDFCDVQNNISYSPQNARFNRNLASVLYEVRSAGHKTISSITTVFPYNIRPESCNGGENWEMINSYRAYKGIPMPKNNSFIITNKILNELANQH
jgi:hypothetical protein